MLADIICMFTAAMEVTECKEEKEGAYTELGEI
jgi:hypothetical protein